MMFMYRQFEKYRVTRKKSDKKYAQSGKGKIARKKATQKYQCSEKGRTTRGEWCQTKKGKIVSKRRNAKHRKLGFIPLMSNPFPKEILIEYHHINNTFVVPVPRQVHKNMLGKNHRVKVNNWVEEHIGLIGV